MPIQRRYNVSCLLAGENPWILSVRLDSQELPAERGLYCRKEFQQAKRFAGWLTAQYGRMSAPSGPMPRRMIMVKFEHPLTDEDRSIAAWVKENEAIAEIAPTGGQNEATPRGGDTAPTFQYHAEAPDGIVWPIRFALATEAMCASIQAERALILAFTPSTQRAN